MNMSINMIKPLLIGLIALVAATGCVTGALHKENRKYANPKNEFKNLNKRIQGKYVGTQYRDGNLSEIYQFPSPFKKPATGGCFEVAFPVYGATDTCPVRGYETQQVAYAGEPAELWLWWDRDVPSERAVKRKAKGRRIDLLWRGGKLVAARRFVPKAESFTTAKRRCAKVPIPWRQRSRFSYSMRNAAYVPTLIADAAVGVGIGAGAVVLTVGYVALECPELICLIICVLDH